MDIDKEVCLNEEMLVDQCLLGQVVLAHTLANPGQEGVHNIGDQSRVGDLYGGYRNASTPGSKLFSILLPNSHFVTACR